MANKYNNALKKKLCEDICFNGYSTIKTAEEYGVPLKTLEKWITAFNKDNHCFDSSDKSNNFNIISPIKENTFYDDLSTNELKKLLIKKDIEITRLKKNYLITKQNTSEKKVFVSFSKKNTR